MSADLLQFLKNKFINGFQEAVDEFTQLPLHSHFLEILDVLQEKRINPSTPIEMKNWLYDLSHALAECVMFSEKEQERKTKNKKSLYRGQSLKELWFLYKTKRELLRIKENLKSMSDNAAAASSSWSPSLIAVRNAEDLLHFEASKIHGFDEQFQNIEALLLETPADNHEGIKAIGIVGMGGSGKTALARMVFESWRIREKFSPRIWVSLSERLNPENIDSRKLIVYEMLTIVGNSGGLTRDSDLDELLSNLRHKLSRRKYLILLDNIWHESDWYYGLGLDSSIEMCGNSRLSDGLPMESGGAVIVTSRLEKVASSMVSDPNLLRIHPTLDAKTCWAIFMDSIERKFFIRHNNPTLLRMKDEIIDKCDGRPLAAKTLAEIISIQIGQERFWSNPSITKLFFLRLDTHDPRSMDMAKEIIRKLPGVVDAYVGGDSHVMLFEELDKFCMRVISTHDPKEIAMELDKFCRTELIGVLQVYIQDT